MTGEMSWIRQDGEDSNGDSWEVHAAIARELGGTLRPFDVYQGPFIALPHAALWVTSDDGAFGRVFNERTEALSEPFALSDIEWAVDSARSVV